MKLEFYSILKQKDCSKYIFVSKIGHVIQYYCHIAEVH